MYAALRAIPIPDDMVARPFHAASLLREHRGESQRRTCDTRTTTDDDRRPVAAPQIAPITSRENSPTHRRGVARRARRYQRPKKCVRVCRATERGRGGAASWRNIWRCLDSSDRSSVPTLLTDC
jgi:hypothetical protein